MENLNELALFAGAGGGILGGHLLGWRTVCAVEWEQYPASVLCARQNDGLLPTFPIWDDVQTFDGKPWRGIVDVVSGGFPCQDISAAGTGGGGLLEAEVQCGNTWQELLARYNPDTLSWRTAQCSLLEDLEQSLETWPRWGSMRSGECFRQPMLAQTTLENESGLSERIPNNIDFFHTPCTTGIDGGSNSRKALKKRMENYPTPNAGMYRNLNYNKELCFKRAEKHQTDLAMVSVMQFGGQLNPAWAEWLMGWPVRWTELKPLEMDKSHCVQQQPGDY